MKYRIVEISKPPKFKFTPDEYWHNCKWYAVEYQDEEPSFGNLGCPRWKRINYNMEKVLRYGTGYCSYKPHVRDDDGIWEVGPFIPSFKMAKTLLEEFLEQRKAKEEQNKPDRVVLSSDGVESTATTCSELLLEFNKFLDDNA